MTKQLLIDGTTEPPPARYFSKPNSAWDWHEVSNGIELRVCEYEHGKTYGWSVYFDEEATGRSWHVSGDVLGPLEQAIAECRRTANQIAEWLT